MNLIFVTGGVFSSLGKGVFASSLARLLKSCDLNVALMKIDPYLNCDAGTLNPFEHGEVFVTRDGKECDLDVGNYERFLGRIAVREQNVMMGSVYSSVIDSERRGEYLGKTLQLIPHVTNEIKKRISDCFKATKCELLVVEIGGTVGDFESDIVLEAIRQLRDNGDHKALYIHMALVPVIASGEFKTKPLQHSVRQLLSRGIVPDAIVCRSDRKTTREIKEKIALFCPVSANRIFDSHNVVNVYSMPMELDKQAIQQVVFKHFGLNEKKADLTKWHKVVEGLKAASENDCEKKVGIVGKYAGAGNDTYFSVFEAISHAAGSLGTCVSSELIDAEKIEKMNEKDLNDYLKQFNGIIVPGGFGSRGVEGKIKVIKYCRENNAPFFGLCYGFQLAVIEIARNVLKLENANTTEIDWDAKYPVIDLLPEQKKLFEENGKKGGTMRLGAHEVEVKKGSKAFELYGSGKVIERFRHRWEVNPKFIEQLEEVMVFSGKHPNSEIMQIGELKNHKFFIGTQFHPEFESTPEKPQALFVGFVKSL